MIPYGREARSAKSGVVAYAIEKDAIWVRFRAGGDYRYGPRRPGAAHVARMKELALAGHGLSTYISRHVKDNYEEKRS